MVATNSYFQKKSFRDKTITLQEFTQSNDFHYLSHAKQIIMAHNLNMRFIIYRLINGH